MEELNGKIRLNNKTHSVRELRRKGFVPGIMYGKNTSNTLFEIGEKDLDAYINRNGEHGVVQIELEGSNHKTLIKEIQRDPVKHKVIHMDLEEISKNEPVQTEIPLIFQGESLLKSKGEIIQKEKNSIKVECNADNIPKHIDVDISGMERNNVLKVKDIEIAAELTIIDDVNAVVVSIIDSNTAAVNDTDNTEDIIPIENSKISLNEKNKRSEE